MTLKSSWVGCGEVETGLLKISAIREWKGYNTSRGVREAWQHQIAFGILTRPCGEGAAELAQLVEQLFRKQQVAGSSPAFGSSISTILRAGVAKRQTRYVQGVVGVTPWEFKSPLRHQVGRTAGNARRFPCQTRLLIYWRQEGNLRNHLATRWLHLKMLACLRSKGMVADGYQSVRGKSGLRRARVPDESQGDSFRRVDSPDRHTGSRVRATVTNAVVRHGVKRAILPAAISDSAVIRLLAKAGSREPSQRRRCDQSSGLREMTI